MMPENPIMGSTLSIPEKPIVSIVRENNSVKFILTSPDGRAVKYLIKKDDGDKILKIHNVYNGWTDTNIKPKKSYTYKIYAIDKNGLVSNPNKVEVTF
jgi:Zn/Cd-binding protein ZinT